MRTADGEDSDTLYDNISFERCVVWCLKTYALAKTALAMDNDLHEYGKKANLLSYDYLEVILTGDQILEVCKNPQNYAIVEVSPR